MKTMTKTDTKLFLIQLGLVCFRLFGSSQLNQKLLTTINASGKLHMVPANVNDYFVIRFCVCAQNSTSEDIGNQILDSFYLALMSKIRIDKIGSTQSYFFGSVS